MWLESRYRLLPVAGQAVVLFGGDAYGAPFLVDRLQQERRVAWLQLSAADADDPVSIGNRLAQAVNNAVEGNLLQSALPYQVHLRTLRLRRELLDELTLVVSGSENEPRFTLDAVEASRDSFGLWLLAKETETAIPGALQVGRRELALTCAEARDLAPAGLPDERVIELLTASGGAYTDFLQAAHRAAGLPGILIPFSDGRLLPESEARHEDPEVVLEALTRLERWIDALEVAADAVPERVEEILVHAGPEYQQQGLLRRLHLLLSLVPHPLESRERTLEWRLVAGHHVGEASRVVPQVRRHLEAHEAPELRARFAAFIPYDEGLREAERASRYPTPLTLWQFGRMHPDALTGIDLLGQSVSHAELAGDDYGSVRAAGALAARYSHLGDFRASRSWAEWGLQLFDRKGLKDGPRRLRLTADLAYARAMLGQLVGLRDQLEEVLTAVDDVIPELASTFRYSLAEVVRLEGDAEEATRLTGVNLELAPRAEKGVRAYQHVRSLLEMERVGEAVAVAESALALTTVTAGTRDRFALLALAMARSFLEDSRDIAAAELLELACDERLVFEQRAMAALHFLQAAPGGSERVPEPVLSSLRGLAPSGLSVLSGPAERFHGIWGELRGEGPYLELKVLGQRPQARFEGREINLTKRQFEITLALALHPDGLSYEELHAFLFQDQQAISSGTLRSQVSHLRSNVPISESPYRLRSKVRVDALDLMEKLRRGEVRDALAMATGPLLPKSSLPGIRELAARIDDALRESVLESGDAEALYSATSLWQDDLEVWEATLESLHDRDPRTPVLRARVESLRAEYGD